MMKKKVVLKLDVHDEKCKQKAMKMVSSLSGKYFPTLFLKNDSKLVSCDGAEANLITGLDSISMDMKEKKLTLIGDIDPVAVVSKLRKVFQTEIVSVGPLKEPEKKKDEPKKDQKQPNKGQPKKDEPNKDQAQLAYYTPLYPRYYHARSIEEDPNACSIC